MGEGLVMIDVDTCHEPCRGEAGTVAADMQGKVVGAAGLLAKVAGACEGAAVGEGAAIGGLKHVAADVAGVCIRPLFRRNKRLLRLKHLRIRHVGWSI